MDLFSLITLTIGIFAGFYVQSAMGFAGSLIALPILLLKFQLPEAIAYISLFYVFSSIFLIYREWVFIDKKTILDLSITSIVGVVLGVLVLSYSKPFFLKKMLGAFILAYVLYSLLGKRESNLGNTSILGLGILAGFFSGIFSTGGPLYIICVENRIKEINTIRATMIGILGLVTLTRIPTLALNGILNFEQCKYAAIIFPIFLSAQFLGRKTFKKSGKAHYKKSILFLLMVSGLSLLF
ncbi:MULTISPECIES: sulfite exporter TauE/SafE family protein [Flavobacteriaceae]|jgi:uncharacterized membrane protein YfcA|uniref:Probable membrane transporter protein n=3 Tax=Flagellimonas TaxID=444459 RepID=A0A3A1NNN7_9FLAO|nr:MULTISPECIES: sulfite exporter TauE/SafE family protein [Allomuricauda]MAO15850.1 permease [Allomuricauda sp.]UBZ14377.1 sulfite exporter TauE/SafE family protein [Allomuricauda aquimarina]MBO0356096.1 sulfite exporter TauE/SafE family protein [Allomuricauda aurea]RIV44798.1 sulfite exporter TauE/SafE family protein [Allomuricauda maritima]TXJ95105.1 sulfite exporter TauE/SafE family protein [Allomuricauda maritima]